ncbi:zinc metalloproteinase nas-14-like [Musca autumnalis]|uniref:zinc metalloproteinase nas-14-like n=1 Tax=Musca autumnalis TaxID=221902 RepID=UPI003CEFF4AE
MFDVDILRNGAITPARRWPNTTVPYSIAEVFGQNQKNAIRTAMNCIEDVSCVLFVEANATTTDYLNIIPSEKGLCASMMGYRGGIQILQLSMEMAKCSHPIVISHELLHTLGFFHEHMTWNRDNCITINWDNIIPGKEIYFKKFPNTTVTDFGYGFDYAKIFKSKRYWKAKCHVQLSIKRSRID